MTTPVDEEAAEAEITRLERETEGLKILTAQQDAANEARMDEVLKAAAAAPPVKTNETRRHHLNELKGVEYPQETDYGTQQSGGALFPHWAPVPLLVIGCAIHCVLEAHVAVGDGFELWAPGYDKPAGYSGTYDKMREKARADYNDAYLNVMGAFAWINLCAAPGCRKKHAHFDHHALSRQFTGPLCNEHNTSGKRARDQFGPEHFVKMAVKAEAHLRVRGDAIAVSDRAGDDPKPIGPGGGHY